MILCMNMFLWVCMFCYMYVILHCLCECTMCADTKISVHVVFVYEYVNEYANVYKKGVDYMRLC